MNIHLLLCDHIREQLQAEYGDYDDVFERFFADINPQVQLIVHRVCDGVFPSAAQLANADYFVLTGSKFSAFDELDWIIQLRTLVQQLFADGKKIAGICFGHQLIATALGGECERSEQGWGVGVHTYTTASDPLLRQRELKLIVTHQDQVTVAPTGADVIASNDFCPIAGFLIANQILTFQGHPEFSKAYAQVLMELRKGCIDEHVYAVAKDSFSENHDGKMIAQLIVDFFRNTSD